MISYGKQDINQDDIDAVIEVLKSDFLTQGPKVPEFESVVADYCGVKYGVAVNSATSALHIACMALEIGPGDIVWTSPISFVASANCVLYCGGIIDFVDINPDTYNMSVDDLTKKLAKAEVEGKLPKAIIPVHMAGQSCDMKSIHELSQKYGFKIIEDASHAIGGSYHEHKVGSCKYSDMTVFSFHPVKIITSAEGGMVMTNDIELEQKLKLLRCHGITREPKLMLNESDGPWYYEQITLGYNYRMSDIQAALGISQMKRLDKFVIGREKIAKNYQEHLTHLPVKLPKVENYCSSSWHLYILTIHNNSDKIRADLIEKMRACGVGSQVHYIPIFTHPYYKKFNHDKGNYPQAMSYYNSALSIPICYGLNENKQEHVIGTLIRELS